MKCEDQRVPMTVGQILAILSFEDNREYVQYVLGPARAEMFGNMLKQLASSFYDQGERHQGLDQKTPDHEMTLDEKIEMLERLRREFPDD